MDREGIKNLADILGADINSAPPSARWLNISCPFAPLGFHKHEVDNHPSFGVQIEKYGVSRMHCLACGKGGASLGSVIMQLKAAKAEVNFKDLLALAQAEFDGAELPTFSDDAPDAMSGLFPFSEAWLDSFPLAMNNGNALVYLAGRKGGPVPPAVTAILGLRYDPFERRVCFPIRGEDKMLYGLHGRAIDEDVELRYMAYGYKKRRNPHVLLGLDTIDWSKPVVYAESVFDYARCKQVYRNVLTGLHATISEYQLEMLTPAFELVTLLDADKAGTLGRQKLQKWAGKKRIVNHVYLPDDMDAGAMPAEELAKELAPFVELDSLIA